MLGLDPAGSRESLVFLYTEVTRFNVSAGILAQGMAYFGKGDLNKPVHTGGLSVQSVMKIHFL